MKTAKKLFFLFFLAIITGNTGCLRDSNEFPPKNRNASSKEEKKVRAEKKFYGKTIGEYSWCFEEQREYLKEELRNDEYNGIYIYEFEAVREDFDVDVTEDWDIIRGEGYIGIPEMLPDNTNRYIFFSNGITPVEVKEYLKSDNKVAKK